MVRYLQPLVVAALACAVAYGDDPALTERLMQHWQPGRGIYELPIALSATEMDAQADPIRSGEAAETPEAEIERLNALIAESSRPGLIILARAHLRAQLGQSEQASRDFLQAEIALREEVAAGAVDTAPWAGLAEVLLITKQEDKALEVLRQGLADDPSRALLLMYLLALDPDTDRALVDQTEQAVRARLAATPGDSEACINLFFVTMTRLSTPDRRARLTELARQDKFAEIEAELRIAEPFKAHQRAHPENAVARWWVGKAIALVGNVALLGGETAFIDLARSGNPALAAFLAPVGEYLSDAPGDPRADVSCYNALFIYRAAQSDADAAIAVLRQAAEAFPENDSIRLTLAETLCDVKNDPEAALEVARAAADQLKTLRCVGSLAWIYLRAGMPEQAADLARKLLSAADSLPTPLEPALARRALLVLAGSAAATGRPLEAEVYVDQAADVLPGPSVAIDRAIVLALKGNTHEARDLLLEVAATDPRSDAVRGLLAILGS